MINSSFVLMLAIFLITVLFIIWRPYGINEAVPSLTGATIIMMIGIVPLHDVYEITGIVSGASITILSTIVMSIVLESIGFFRWAAHNLLEKANGSGVKLYWYINLLCFTMTLFMNNDGSILITTPIIIHIVNLLKLKPHQKLPYLFAGVLIATASSAPIGVSNLANLIALKIVGLDLNSYAKIMFIPSMIGILVISILLFIYFQNDIPKRFDVYPTMPTVHEDGSIHKQNTFYQTHPLQNARELNIDWWMFRVCIIVVVLIRGSFFALTPLGIPIELIAIIGAVILIIIRWYKKKGGIVDIIKKTPWHIFIFAFSMYVIVYGLRNIGFTSMVVETLREPVSANLLNASIIMGFVTTIMSNLFNNLPSIMIGTLVLVDMGLESHTLQVSYLASVIGSDIGALLTPMGTLATLIWMFILRKNGIDVSWGMYFRVTFMIIPIGLIVSLLSLYIWAQWIIF